MRRILPLLLLGISSLSLVPGVAYSQDKAKGAAIVPEAVNLGRPVDFEKDVYPILDASCLACHNAAITENGLNLEDVAHILKGGKKGPSVIPKDPDKSLLFKLASRGMAPAMPPLPNKVQAEALTPKDSGGGLHGGRMGGGTSDQRKPLRFVLPPGALS